MSTVWSLSRESLVRVSPAGPGWETSFILLMPDSNLAEIPDYILIMKSM